MLKTQALLLESVSSMRLWRTHKLSRPEVFRACACGGYTSSFFSRVFQFALVIRTDFRVSNVSQAALVENTQVLPISVCDEHALVMNTRASRQEC